MVSPGTSDTADENTINKEIEPRSSRWPQDSAAFVFSVMFTVGRASKTTPLDVPNKQRILTLLLTSATSASVVATA